MATLRAGIIGLNGIAVRHVMDIEANEELRLGAVCDTDTELGLRWQGEHDAPWYKDYRDINRSEHCDFVIVALPHYLHAEVACDALEAGKPVIIQKPMCITVEEADRIIATAQRTGTKVATFHTAHLVECDARALIAQGVVGDMLRVHYARQEARSVAYYGTGPWRGRWATEGGGMLTNQYIHDLNRLHYLCGPVVEVVNCTLANVGHPGIEVEDACTAVVRFANGAYGELSLGLYSQPGLSGYEIVGDRGCIVKRGDDQRYTRLSIPLTEYLHNPTPAPRRSGATLADAARPEATWQEIPPVAEHRDVVAEFAQAIRDDTPPYAPPEFARRDIELMCALYMAHFQRQAVQIPIPRAAYTALLHDLAAGKYPSLAWPGPGHRIRGH